MCEQTLARADAPPSNNFLVHFGRCNDATLARVDAGGWHYIGPMPFFVDLPAFAVCHPKEMRYTAKLEGCAPHLDIGRAVRCSVGFVGSPFWRRYRSLSAAAAAMHFALGAATVAAVAADADSS